MSIQVNMHEAKTHFSKLVDQVLRGQSVTVARAGRPVVDIVPHSRKTVIFGLGKDTYSFDEAAFSADDADIARMFYGDAE